MRLPRSWMASYGSNVAPPPSAVLSSWPTTRARQWLDSFLDRARSDANVLVVVGIGSSVRPGFSADDLDLVVLCRDCTRLSEKPPIEVDLRCFDWDRVDEELRRARDMLVWSVRFGKTLYDPDDRWDGLTSRWQGRLPLPDAAEATRRAEVTRAQMESMRAVGDTDAGNDLNLSYLTHLARARLSEAGLFPASRPELPTQLRGIGQQDLAAALAQALALRASQRMAATTT